MRLAAAAITVATALSATPVAAETLREALARAYATNPTLTAARAGQRATDESVPIQRARGLPGVNATANYNDYIDPGTATTSSIGRSLTGGVTVSVPIYEGGLVRNGVRAADARVQAGQANLRDTELSLFSQVVGAYMDVIRDSAIVALNAKQVEVLRINLEATSDRFQVGDLTRTDVAQSQARFALAQGQFEQAEAQLIASKESYVRLVGTPPGTLEPPPPLPGFPATPDAAVAVAIDNNPGLLAAIRRREAARFDIGVAKAGRLPRLSVVGSEQYSNYLGSLRVTGFPGALPQTSRTTTVGLQATIPLFQGGGPGAQVRQAQALDAQATETVTLTERSVVAQTRSAYASWRASTEQIASYESSVAATALSLEGVRAENSVGNRSILDILNAEQETLNAQVNLVSARRNAYVAGFTLLAAMGKAGAKDLGLAGGVLYDPQVNYDRVRHSVNDFASDGIAAPVATRTVDSPAQTPALMGPPVR